MRKLISIILVLMIIMSMAVTAYAVTPKLNVPKVPQISNIKFNVEVDIPQSFWDRWFAEHPIRLK